MKYKLLSSFYWLRIFDSLFDLETCRWTDVEFERVRVGLVEIETTKTACATH